LINSLVGQIELQNELQLAFFICAIVVIIIFTYLAPKLGIHTLRNIPQIDAFREAIGVCAEKGVPAVFTFGTMSLSFPVVAIPGIMEAAKSIAYHSSELDVRTFFTVAVPEIHIMALDYVRQGHITAGHPERFRTDDVIYYGRGHQLVLGSIELFERYDCAALIVWGNFGFASHIPLMEFACRKNAFIIHAQGHTCEGTLGALFTDLVAVLEEQVIAGPYLSGDVQQMGNIFGEDLVKMGYCTLIVILTILYAAGVSI
jgi:hypothetical protein